jgi:hypothetical protein
MEMPVIDAEESELRELGRQTDIAEGRIESSEGTPTTPEAVPPTEEPREPQKTPDQTPPSSSEPEPQVAQRQRDERGRFKQDQAPEQPPSENGKEPEQPKSQYAQAREREAKENERFDRSWSKFVADRDAFRKEQQAWQDQRRMEQLGVEAKMQPLQKDGIDIQGYHKAYLDFRANAENDHQSALNAMRSLETVLELENMGKAQQQYRQNAALELQWRNDMESAIQSEPSLLEPDSPLAKEVDRIVADHPYLFYIPQGFHKAVEIGTLLLAAGSDSELREENEALRAELEQYRRGSQPAKGGYGKPPSGPKRQEDMTLEEEESYLKGLGAREDAAMGR